MNARTVIAWSSMMLAPNLHALNQPLDPPTVSIWSVAPAAPTTRDFIRLKNVFTGCQSGAPGGHASVDLQARKVIVEMWGSDICTVVYDDISYTSVGYLPAGNYTVEFYGCAGEFPPGQQCTLLTEPRLSFGVADAGRPRATIPASSPSALLALAGCLAALGAWKRARRQKP